MAHGTRECRPIRERKQGPVLQPKPVSDLARFRQGPRLEVAAYEDGPAAGEIDGVEPMAAARVEDALGIDLVEPGVHPMPLERPHQVEVAQAWQQSPEPRRWQMG